MDYKEIYTKDYFTGKSSCFYKFGYRNFWYFDHHYKMLQPYIPKGGKVLDVGCATGFFLSKFAQEGYTVWGMDVSAYAVQTAKKLIPQGTFVQQNAEETFPFENNFFDFISMEDILEHLLYPEKALFQASRVLKKGGIIYVGGPQLSIIRRVFYKIPDKLEHHVSLKTVAEMNKMLTDYGFEIIASWTTLNPFVATKRFPSWLSPEFRIIAKKL